MSDSKNDTVDDATKERGTRKLRRPSGLGSTPAVVAAIANEPEPAAAEPGAEFDAATPVGKRFGRYHVGYELASGGMATVYLASLRAEAGFEKVLALKCIHPHLSKDPRFVRMFRDEARIASRVTHANVVHIFDFGIEEGTHFLAMEYLEGKPFGEIRARCAERSTPDTRLMLLRAIVDACEGLHAVHELEDGEGRSLGVVHRDVSPQNVFVTFDGTAKLLDFGIARAHDQLHRTETGELKGNLPYVSPEQVRGADVDRRSDLWSVGVMLWEVLAGKRLFDRGNAAETLFAVINEMVRRVDGLDPTLPSELGDVVAKALQRDPNDRFTDARELGRAIQNAAQGLGSWPTQADLAEWLDQLFPDARSKTRAQIAATRDLLNAPQTVIHRKRRAGMWPLAVFLLLASIGIVFVALPGDDSAAPAAMPAEPDLLDDIHVPALPDEPVMEAVVEPVMRTRPRMRPRMRSTMITTMDEVSSEPGRVTIVTPDGWAEVSLEGRPLGVTPLNTTLPAGRHELQLRPFGMGPTKRVRVDVRAGQPVRRSVRVQ